MPDLKSALNLHFSRDGRTLTAIHTAKREIRIFTYRES
jgi:hypothetical protein